MSEQQSKELELLRTECENDLFFYAQMMFPKRYFGDVHKEMFQFFQKGFLEAMESGEGANLAALIPRDHQKSFCIAVCLTWIVTKFPWITTVYCSSNPKLTEKQLDIIKKVFQSEIHRELWPEMLNYEVGRSGQLEHKPKGKWTQLQISVDHPDRPNSEKDPTVEATSAKSTNTGNHFKVCIFDDLVTNENYKSAAEREELKEVYQSFASIATTGSIMLAVGTRYGDDDLYATWKEMEFEVWDEKGEQIIETRPVWEFFERKVESSKTMDGSGVYLWPRQKWTDSEWYGFDRTQLSRKKAQMPNHELFYCQYYNEPNAVGTERVQKEHFQYANPMHLRQDAPGVWFYGDKQLSLGCGMDLAFTENTGGLKKIRRDYTAISVIGWDDDGYLYVLEQRRFQTQKAEVYYQNLIDLWNYWGFKEATVESNGGGKVIAQFIQDEVRKHTGNLIIKAVPSTRNKEERIEETLEALYRQKSVFHFKGGYTKYLEEELRLSRPAHDDLKDSLFIAVVNSSRRPKSGINFKRINKNVVQAGNRFYNRRRR